jgi:hypothetical protein
MPERSVLGFKSALRLERPGEQGQEEAYQRDHRLTLSDSVTRSMRMEFSVHTGVRFGRKPKLSRYQIEEAIARREAGEALIDIGRSYNVSHSTISRLASD